MELELGVELDVAGVEPATSDLTLVSQTGIETTYKVRALTD